MKPTAPQEYEEFWKHANQCGKLPRWNELPKLELYMDQVITLMNQYMAPFVHSSEPVLTPSMINNYVKLDLLPPPNKKKYSREHLSCLLVICLMKPVCSMAFINDLITRQLKERTNEEFHEYFCDFYEKTFLQLNRVLKRFISRELENGDDLAKVLAQISLGAAAVSSGSKFLSGQAMDAARAVNRRNKRAALTTKEKKS